MLELIEAVILGVVQGLTEFLPVSSSGHLLLGQYFLGLDQDRFGLSWQVVPNALGRLLGDPDRERADRTLQAMLKMRKLDIAVLEAAADGG